MHFDKRKALTIIATGLAMAAAPAALHAQQKPPVKLAVITSLTGPFAGYGKIQELLTRLAMDDINAAGGINGSKLQLDVGDAQLDPGQAVLLFRKYTGEGYFGVVGPLSGTQWETVSPIANQLGMPAISANAVKPGVTIKPWTIRLQPPDDTLMPEGLKAFMKAYPKVKKVVIAADVREASSKASADAFAKLARENGLELLDTIEFSSKATDLSAAAIQIKSRNPDAILAAAFPPQAMLLAKEFNVQGVNVPVLNTSILWAGPFISVVGNLGANWHVIGFSTNDEGAPGSTNIPLYQSIVKRVLPKGDAVIGNPPNVANWSIGYDAVLLYADILRRNGMDGTTDPRKARETIKNEFLKLKSFEGVYKYTMRDTGDGHLPTTILKADIEKKVWQFVPGAR